MSKREFDLLVIRVATIIMAAFYTNSSYCQTESRLSGVYKFESSTSIGSVEIRFVEHQFFTKEPNNYNGYRFSKGLFWQQGDTVILAHLPLEDTLASNYVCEEKRPLKKPVYGEFLETESMIIDFTVCKSDSTRIPGAIAIFSGQDRLIIADYTSEKGTYSLYTESAEIESAEFSFIGVKSLKMDLKAYRGFHSKISVYLSESKMTYNQEYEVDSLIFDGIRIHELGNSGY